MPDGNREGWGKGRQAGWLQGRRGSGGRVAVCTPLETGQGNSLAVIQEAALLCGMR